YPAPAIDVDRIMKAIPFAADDTPERERAQPGWMGAANVSAFLLGADPNHNYRFPRRLAAAAALGFIVFGGVQIYLASSDASVAKGPVVTAAPPAVVRPPTVPLESSVVAAAPAQIRAPAASPTHRNATISFGGGLGDLSDDQLAALLSELDTLEALPTTEPETHLSPIVPEADGGHNAR
ncbi:MAG TPA: hypothetical protein VGQ30_13105, partial [Gemmatimonadaceae bacterium]|nr:hypothetical protein [Gemmatimonadaceae bacterium]